MFNISPLCKVDTPVIRDKIDQKTKPQGALGRLESLALQLALITGSKEIVITQPRMLVFAGDHGIARENISVAPSEVTGQMVSNFLVGGAAINCFCRASQMTIDIVDAGILERIDDPRLIQQSLGAGTANFVDTMAMSESTVNKGLELGARLVKKRVAEGTNLFGFGEMGIGNTSSASCLMSLLTGLPALDCVGRGTGISDEQYSLKLSLIEQALKRHQLPKSETFRILAAVGGFEIVQMIGAMLAAAEAGCVLLVDGFISTVAALIATRIESNSRDYLIFCHQSAESGHQLLLDLLSARPLLSLDLRLGEGTGAALALPIIRAAQSFYNDMASFESAGVKSV